jgi:PKD repeat protein
MVLIVVGQLTIVSQAVAGSDIYIPVEVQGLVTFNGVPAIGANVSATWYSTDGTLQVNYGDTFNFGGTYGPYGIACQPGRETILVATYNGFSSAPVVITPPVADFYTAPDLNIVVPAPVASFTGAPTGGDAPLTVAFDSSGSAGAISSYAWDFDNNGVTDSTAANPSHTYNMAGIYTVKLTVTAPGGSNTMTRTDYINVINPAVTPAFSASVRAGVAPLSVQFTDASTGSPTSWKWEYQTGAGSWTEFSSARNTTYSFVTAGVYSIRLTATNAVGSSAVTKTDYIAVSAGPKPLTTVTNGVVSGDLYIGAYQPVPWSNQSTAPGVKTFTQAYAVPAHTSVAWARLYAVVYAAGTDDRAGRATVSFDSNGDGVFETALGTEDLRIPATSGAEVYAVNDHVNRQYSDYMMWYDVTGLINAGTVNAKIVTENPGGSNFDGRLKTLTLVVAYSDGDLDQVYYWVNDGHDYQSSTGSAGSTGFATASLTAGIDAAQMVNVHLSSKDAAYTFNGVTYTGANPVSPYGSFVKNVWDVQSSVAAGADSTLAYTHAALSSFKTPLAALKVVYLAPPVAAFSVNKTLGSAPMTVQFDSSASTGVISSYVWDFDNDGVVDSMAANPAYTYSAAGVYTVKLTVTGPGGSDDEVKTAYVTVTDQPILSLVPSSGNVMLGTTKSYDVVIDKLPAGLAGFDVTVALGSPAIGTITGVTYPAWATFTNTGALPADSVRIVGVDTGNAVRAGNTNVKLATITISGDAAGMTAVNLGSAKIDEDGGGSLAFLTNPGSLLVYEPLVAGFTATPLTGTAPLTVQFTDASTGTPASWAWDFNNDGVTDSTAQSPSYTYNAWGVYTVKLTVTNQYMSDDEVKTGYVNVIITPPVAGFTTVPASGDAPLTVQFTDQSLRAATYAWDFDNDGTVDSTVASPTYTYSTPGVYTVKLTVTNAGGSDDEVKDSYITVRTPLPTAAFVANATAGYAPLTVQFTDQSLRAATYAWDFDNDGTVDSTVASPTYTYSTPGVYTVKLTVTNAGGSDDELKTSYVTAYAKPQVSITPSSQETMTGTTKTYNIVVDSLPRGLAGFDLTIGLDSPGIGEIVGVTYPSWVSFTQTTGMPGDSVRIRGLDANRQVGAGASNMVLVTVTVRGDAAGLTAITPGSIVMDDDDGNAVAPGVAGATLDVYPVLTAEFTANVTAGYAPMSVQFTDTSAGAPTSWAWDFNGDGVTDSTVQSPTYTYSTPGVYTVTLTASNSHMSDADVKTGYVAVFTMPHLSLVPSGLSVVTGSTRTYNIVADTLPNGLAGYDLVVSLGSPSIGEITNVSYPSWADLNMTVPPTPADSVRIVAVDLHSQVEAGATNVVLATITVRGDTPGTTTIALGNAYVDDDGALSAVPDLTGSSLTVFQPLAADFSATPLAGTQPLTVTFADLTTGTPGPNAWQWDFGDGITSALQNPSHVYATAGDYTVTLTATNAYNGDVMTKSQYIRVTPIVETFPDRTNLPADPDGDGLYEDVNGNGRLDFDDVVVFYQNMDWVRDNSRVGIAPYDFNGNGRIDFDDIVQLFQIILG